MSTDLISLRSKIENIISEEATTAKPQTLDEWLASLTDQHPKRREADYAYRMLQLAMDRNNASAEETWRTNLRRLGAPV